MRHEPQREIFRPLPADWYAFHFNDDWYLGEYKRLQDAGQDERSVLRYANALIKYPAVKLDPAQEKELFLLFNYLKWRLSGHKEAAEARGPVRPDVREQIGKTLTAQDPIEQLVGLLALYVDGVYVPTAIRMLQRADWQGIGPEAESELKQDLFGHFMTKAVSAYDCRGAGLGTFVVRVVLNKAADLRRRRQRQAKESQGNQELSTGEPIEFWDMGTVDPSQIIIKDERRKLIREYLPNLLGELRDSPELLEMIQLVLCDLTQDEISKILAVSRPQVQRGIAKARENLKNASEAEQFKILRQVIQEVVSETKSAPRQQARNG